MRRLELIDKLPWVLDTGTSFLMLTIILVVLYRRNKYYTKGVIIEKVVRRTEDEYQQSSETVSKDIEAKVSPKVRAKYKKI